MKIRLKQWLDYSHKPCSAPLSGVLVLGVLYKYASEPKHSNVHNDKRLQLRYGRTTFIQNLHEIQVSY